MGTVSGTWLAHPTVMETELFAACTEGDVAKAKELLKKETKETIDQVDFYGYTALHAACEAGHADLIVPLLRLEQTSTEPPMTPPSHPSTTHWPRPNGTVLAF